MVEGKELIAKDLRRCIYADQPQGSHLPPSTLLRRVHHGIEPCVLRANCAWASLQKATAVGLAWITLQLVCKAVWLWTNGW